MTANEWLLVFLGVVIVGIPVLLFATRNVTKGQRDMVGVGLGIAILLLAFKACTAPIG